MTTTIHDFKAASQRHYAVYDGKDTSTSHLLLLFYAVECLVKAKFLTFHSAAWQNPDESKLNTLPSNLSQLSQINTSGIPSGATTFGGPYGHGHDLYQWAKLLKLGQTEMAGYVEGEPNAPNNSPDKIAQLQVYLKYGTSGVLGQSHTDRQIEFLKSVYEHFRNTI